jgi:short-subunit dehydrogenase
MHADWALKRNQANRLRQERKRQRQDQQQQPQGSFINDIDDDDEDGDDDDIDEDEDGNSNMGFALVTGASRGIGRAIAVQLARYEIPLILVARDIDRLVQLAYDIEACYGVKCCVLQADLGIPGVAESIFQTTQEANLPVDILINNAGFTLHGLSVDLPIQKVNTMIQLNAVSASTLAHLYGHEMKQRGRGRVMMVSSICGAVAGLPTVAVYAATKAFENSLSLSMGKELEPYGVGVTCVMPGAVRDTEFKSKSNTEHALCWHLPFYTRTAQQVADMSKNNINAIFSGHWRRICHSLVTLFRCNYQVCEPCCAETENRHLDGKIVSFSKC